MHQGSCLCGAVRYEISAPITLVTHCHCSMCRKAHGAAFGSHATIAREKFRFTAGEDSVTRYASSPGVERSFCAHCGSTLQWSSDRRPDDIAIAAGTLDTPLAPPPQRHIYTDSRASWYRIEDTLPQTPDRHSA